MLLSIWGIAEFSSGVVKGKPVFFQTEWLWSREKTAGEGPPFLSPIYPANLAKPAKSKLLLRDMAMRLFFWFLNQIGWTQGPWHNCESFAVLASDFRRYSYKSRIDSPLSTIQGVAKKTIGRPLFIPLNKPLGPVKSNSGNFFAKLSLL